MASTCDIPLNVQIMKQQEKDEKEADELMNQDERSRSYGAVKGNFDEPTEEEMEAYRLRLNRSDDPMSNFM